MAQDRMLAGLLTAVSLPSRAGVGLLGALAFVGMSGPPALAGQDPFPPLTDYHVRTFGLEDGLLAAHVFGLHQTSDGFLYVSGARGLVRFDGHRFHPVELPGAPTTWIRIVFGDGGGRLWLNSDAGDVGYILDDRFHSVGPLGAALRFSETSDGTVWFYHSGSLWRLPVGQDGHKTARVVEGARPGEAGFRVLEAPGGEHVVASNLRMARLEAEPERPGALRMVGDGPPCPLGVERADPDGLQVLCMDEEAGPYLLRYGSHGFVRMDEDGASGASRFRARDWLPRDGRALPLPAWAWLQLFPDVPEMPSGEPSLGLLARDGSVWLVFSEPPGTRHQLKRYRGGAFRPVPLDEHAEFQYITRLFEDREGSVWVGTDRGLFQLPPRRVFSLTRDDGLAEGFVVPVRQTRDGAVWVGTWGGGLHRFAGAALPERLTSADGLPGNRVRALHEGVDGTLWIGTFRGFAAWRDGRIAFSRALQEVRAFAERDDGTLWIGASDSLLLYSEGALTPHSPDFWHGRGISALHVARDGSLWIGAETGLFRLAGDTVRRFGEADGLRGSFFVSIHEEEEDGTLWFGTYEDGLHRYRGGRFTALTTEHGMPHNGIWRMLEDRRGGVWMSSDGGLFRIERARLHALTDELEGGGPPLTPLSPLVFTETDGLPNREFNRGAPGGWALADGRLVFNNIAGVVVVDPERATAVPLQPRAAIHRVEADGQPVVPGEDGTARLPAGVRHIAFELAALSYLAPEQNRYRYRLDGFDEEWVYAGTRRDVSYTRLPPGRYTLRAQGATGLGDWSGPEEAFAFAVAPFLWQTWWFRIGAGALLLGMLVTAYRLRVRRLLALERLRLSIAADLHDDVGASLSSIALLSEMLRRRVPPQGAEHHQLDRINRAATETIHALRDIIWLVDPGHDDLRHLFRRMRSVAGNLANGVECSFHATEPDDPKPVPMEFIRNALLIYKEGLHNVVRHAGARKVEIEVAAESGLFLLRIRDDGVGFDTAAVRRGRGLDNMRGRAERTGGRLEVVSEPGRGTEVTFRAPLA